MKVHATAHSSTREEDRVHIMPTRGGITEILQGVFMFTYPEC